MTEPAMSIIPVEEAVGSILCHDITRIVPGGCKGPAFKKGHIVTEEDVPELLKLGKEHLYVWREQPGMLHENEAAARLSRAAAGENLSLTEPSEGKITFKASRQGLLRINVPLLNAVNSLGDIAFATLHSLRTVAAGEAVAGARVIPLIVPENLIARAERLCAESPEPVLSVLPFHPFRIGVIITGSEVYHGRIQDGFGPVLRNKFAKLGCTTMPERFTPDDTEQSRAAIHSLAGEGADMIVLTGGMSVDPDDRTPAAVRASGAEIIRYGAPVLPGAMFLLATLKTENAAPAEAHSPAHHDANSDVPRRNIPILGLPGCVMYHSATIFDLIVPRLLAGVNVTAADLASLGHGGFCPSCPECRFPRCSFGA